MRRNWPVAALLLACTSPLAAKTQATAPLSALIDRVDIPYEQFTLANGLKVLVHTDRKAPIVGVTVYYDVGSKQEPKGKTGFAHLFEHLMFGGSENVPNFDEPLVSAGSTPTNGSTWYDRTNYIETVPVGALERALYMESDRMGYLLGAVTQAKLDAQRGVVQNEKRQGDNQPYGLVEYAQLAALLPPTHPYGHSAIGSMTDLDAASLDDVKAWFRQHYGPNNAILVLAGDIDAKTARPLVEKYFGPIPRGPEAQEVEVAIPTLATAKSETIKDRVATTRIYRNWTAPGLNHPDETPLQIGAAVLGGLSSSRLDNALVRKEKLAVAVTAQLQTFEQLSFFEVSADVTPGVDPAVTAKRLDELIAELIANGPTADEVKRVAARTVSARIAGLEQVGGFDGKAVTLAEGLLYSGDPANYKRELRELASATPAQVTAAMQKWLRRPVYALNVVPGDRDAYEEAKAGAKGQAETQSAVAPAADVVVKTAKRDPLPGVADVANLDFPDVQRAKLSNGITVVYAQRSTVPITLVSLSLDAGNAADRRDKLGTQSLMLSLLDEGAAGKNSIQIAEIQELLGANIAASSSMDRTRLSLFALSANLAPSLDLFADIALRPDFAPAEVDRLRAQQLARISAELTNPGAIASRALPPMLYGAGHPYGVPFTGTGDPQAVSTVTRNDLLAFHRAWFRPEKATMFVVSDRPLAEVQPLLDQRFGSWRGIGEAGVKNFAAAPPAAAPKIVLIDRKDSPQSYILGGVLTPVKGTDELAPLLLGTQVVSDDFLSRLNQDLRETKAWSYGVRGRVERLVESAPYLITAPVQADKTGPSIAAIRTNVSEFVSTKGVTPEELARVREGSIRELPGSFESAADVLGGMERNVLFGRSDDYYETLAARYRAVTADQLNQAAREAIDPSKVTWVVVGDASIVAPQLDSLGLPVEVMTASKPAKGEK
jgi:predicted Zn-dependent peptidase